MLFGFAQGKLYMKINVSAVITSGGMAKRFGKNKMFFLLKGKPLIINTVQKFSQSKKIDEIIVLVRKEEMIAYKKLFEKEKLKVKLVAAKKERIISVYAGALAAQGKYVITHDGNRPLTPVALIDKLIEEVIKYKAAMTAIAPTATVKYSDGLFINKSLPRSKTWIAQTPQGFEKKLLLKAFEKAIKNKYFVPTDDSEIMSNFGKKVKIVPGDEINIKITYPQDIIIANELINYSDKKNMNKVGLGQDSHAFESPQINKPLILGGIKISDHGGLKANSDGDVILHSLCNALSSAIGGDSLGTWSDDMCLKQGIKDSTKYLKYIIKIIKNKNYFLENISISVEAKKPRLDINTIKKIKERLAVLLSINLDQVGITFTSGEELTTFGRGEAIQAFTIVSLYKRKE